MRVPIVTGDIPEGLSLSLISFGISSVASFCSMCESNGPVEFLLLRDFDVAIVRVGVFRIGLLSLLSSPSNNQSADSFI